MFKLWLNAISAVKTLLIPWFWFKLDQPTRNQDRAQTWVRISGRVRSASMEWMTPEIKNTTAEIFFILTSIFIWVLNNFELYIHIFWQTSNSFRIQTIFFGSFKTKNKISTVSSPIVLGQTTVSPHSRTNARLDLS